ncbi:autotransporter beta-domain-containing protein [Acetobacter sp. CAG:267]|nr:autotransporter beta-domain-containing protein [Acetobacter sp. CAG:267]
MKNKLLLTTALVGVAFALPTMAAEEWDGKTSHLIPQGETLVLEENSLVEKIINNVDGIGGALSTSKPKNGVENPGTLIVKSGTVFKNNTAKYDGGAIANFGVLDIDGATFEANKSQTETTDSQPVGGGAISLGIDSKTTIKNTKFVNNVTGFNGGAIGTRRTINNGDITNGSHENHSLIISDSAFIGNKATGTTTDQADNKLQGGNGGAIANSFNNTQISNTVFEKNEAINGGAVYNQSLYNTNNQAQETDKGGDIKFADVTFDGNKASTNGGAIFNDANTNAELSGTVVFSGNEAGNAGGAIFVAGASSSMEIASGAVFKSNSAKLGGAIYNKGNLGTLDGVTFEDNTAETNGGAILNSNGGTIASITNSIFKNNTSTNGGGAAIYNKGGEIAEISNTVFEGNIAEKGNGGAIFNGGTTAANITLDNVQFIGNQATNGSGGAISTSGVVDIANATFENNSASTGGGAINVDGTVKLSGENTFSGNKVGDKLNDINLNQNNGQAKVDVSGTLTLDGGISGEGSTSFADNTKLNITENTTFGEDVAITIGENTELGLIVDSGEESAEFDTSKLLGENGFTLADNALYNAIVGDDGKVTMEQKSADEAAASLGLSGSQAEAVLGAISGGSSDNANFNSFREALNQHLQSADKAQVSNGTGAADLLTADANPVIRSVETGIHNMVFSAVSDELNGTSAAMAEGKSSGDAFKQVKAWVRALFSHSDHESTSKASGFDTNSDGVAMGIDKQLDNRTKVGLGYAYSSTDISSGIRDTDVDTHTAFVYGQYKPANWYINTVVAYNWSDYSEKKAALGFNANADYDVESWAVQSLYGYEMQLNGYDVTPEAGLRYAHISQDGYTDALGTSVAANDSDILTAIVGAKVAKDYALDSDTIIRPELRAAVTYDLVDDANNSNVVLANGVAYRVNGEKLNRLGFELGAKVATDVSDNWEISLAYEGGFREDYQNHTGMLNAKYKF